MSGSPPIRFLFRYRDLVAKTLEEHRQVLQKNTKSGCWWGWWKRPHEDARKEVWDAIGSEIAASSSGRIRVGLFDSGAADNVAVHAVWIDSVRGPVHGGTTLDPLSLSKAELKLVPAYYRSSPFSRAWMRIVRIEDDPINFFGYYSHLTPPLLPNFAAGALARLKDNVIMGAVDLRSMDATIWEVRPRKTGDREERLFIPSPYREPVTSEPMPVSGNRILHLTDVHFSTGVHRKQHGWRLETEESSRGVSMAEAIGNATKNLGVAVLLITGDLTFLANAEEFKAARLSIQRLIGILGLGLEHVIIVPGNHDIRWTKDPGATYTRESGVDQAPAEAQAEYRAFFRDLFQVDAHPTLAMGRRYVFPHGGMVEIGAVNSSSLEQGKNFLAGMGRVRGGGFDELAGVLAWNEKSTSHALRILGLHHHVATTEDVEDPAEYYKGFGMAIDAKNTQRLCARSGVHMIVHGHRHRAFIGRVSVCELPEESNDRWTLGNVSIVGGGSAGSTEVVAKSNYFSLITVSPDGVSVGFYRSKDAERFDKTPASTWTAPVNLQAGRLVLGDWSHQLGKNSNSESK